MKALPIVVGLLITFTGFSQKYTIGLVKTGSVIKNVEGEFILSDSTVTTTIDKQTTVFKITSRNGFNIHVTDGTDPHRFVIGHAGGKLHGFTYDRHISYHSPKHHHLKTPTSIYYCLMQPKETPGR